MKCSFGAQQHRCESCCVAQLMRIKSGHKKRADRVAKAALPGKKELCILISGVVLLLETTALGQKLDKWSFSEVDHHMFTKVNPRANSLLAPMKYELITKKKHQKSFKFLLSLAENKT